MQAPAPPLRNAGVHPVGKRSHLHELVLIRPPLPLQFRHRKSLFPAQGGLPQNHNNREMKWKFALWVIKSATFPVYLRYSITMRCARCGNSSLVPTSLGLLDDLRSMFGLVRYRCVRCNSKQLERLWPPSEARYAHCPQCFSGYLQRWSPAFMGQSTLDTLKRMLGGRTHRCLECSCAFTSWRRANPKLRSDGQPQRLMGLSSPLTPSAPHTPSQEALSSHSSRRSGESS